MLTLMLALSSASLTAYAATPAAVTATPALAVTLPSNPKLAKSLSGKYGVLSCSDDATAPRS
ncbi:hypothetical protein, partial [Deinococcus indicus]|uniref:hypothetical protein n=1 Tax=Deinococcus indicus TaxID=223556 RepID=UPI001E53C431